MTEYRVTSTFQDKSQAIFLTDDREQADREYQRHREYLCDTRDGGKVRLEKRLVGPWEKA